MVEQAKHALKSKRGITITSIVATIMMIGGVFQVAPALGLQIPRWAWVSELEASEQQFARLLRPVSSERLEKLRQEETTLDLAIDQLRAEGQEVPSWMIREAVDIRLQIERWQEVDDQIDGIIRGSDQD